MITQGFFKHPESKSSKSKSNISGQSTVPTAIGQDDVDVLDLHSYLETGRDVLRILDSCAASWKNLNWPKPILSITE